MKIGIENWLYNFATKVHLNCYEFYEHLFCAFTRSLLYEFMYV